MSVLRILVFYLLPLSTHAADNLIFHNAYIAAAPPAAAAMAGYMSVENPGAGVRSITAISSADFSAVEIHRTIIAKGVARMEPVESLVIEPGATLELKPGGIHLMLLAPKHDFEAGETVLLELKESDGTLHSLAVKVQRRSGATHQHHH
ncbi:MAG TPA: copper chaperone PCu(A)C [Gammaproteobacteria bacterium]